MESKCPHCGRPDFIDQAYIGEDLRCKHCGVSLTPEPKPPPSKWLRNTVLAVGLLLLVVACVLIIRSEPVLRAYKEALGPSEDASTPTTPAPGTPLATEAEEEEPRPVRPAHEKLYKDLSYEEANDILGSVGKKKRSVGRGDSARTTYEWRLQDGTVVLGIFEGGRLSSWEVQAR